MNTSTEIEKLATAYAKMQGQTAVLKKDALNPFFNSKYADLSAVVEVIKKPFADNELSYIQCPEIDDFGNVILLTRVMHSSGQWLEFTLRMKPLKADPQGVGSAIAYCRRYALQSVSGLAAADDDGNDASTMPAEKKPANDARRSEPMRNPNKAPSKPSVDDALTAQQSDPGYLLDLCQGLERAWKKPGSIVGENPAYSAQWWIINRDLLLSCGHKDAAGAAIPKALFKTGQPDSDLSPAQTLALSKKVMQSLDTAANRGKPATPMHPNEV